MSGWIIDNPTVNDTQMPFRPLAGALGVQVIK